MEILRDIVSYCRQKSGKKIRDGKNCWIPNEKRYGMINNIQRNKGGYIMENTKDLLQTRDVIDECLELME